MKNYLESEELYMEKHTESLHEGDWIVEKGTKRLGFIYRKDNEDNVCSIVFFTGVALRTLPDIELAQSHIREEDLLAMQHMAVENNDKDWFEELGERLKVSIKQV